MKGLEGFAIRSIHKDADFLIALALAGLFSAFPALGNSAAHLPEVFSALGIGGRFSVRLGTAIGAGLAIAGQKQDAQ